MEPAVQQEAQAHLARLQAGRSLATQLALFSE